MTSLVSTGNYSVILLLAFGSTSFVCSCSTLGLIYSMGRYNGYTKLVACLTICQAVYDISVLLISAPSDRIFFQLRNYLRTFSGITTTLWTNVISFIVLYIVWHSKPFDIRSYFKYLAVFTLLPALLLASLQLIVDIYGLEKQFRYAGYVYDGIRLLSIAVNILFYLVLTITERLRHQRMYSTHINISIDPISTLVYRIKYYPVVQVITRVGVSIYEEVYGYSYDYRPHLPLGELISLFVYSITLPSAGIGYFLVMVTVTPGAYLHLQQLCGFAPRNGDTDKQRASDQVASSSEFVEDGVSENSLSSSQMQQYLSLISDQGNGSHGTGISERLIEDVPNDWQTYKYREMDEARLSEEIERNYHLRYYPVIIDSQSSFSTGTGIDNWTQDSLK